MTEEETSKQIVEGKIDKWLSIQEKMIQDKMEILVFAYLDNLQPSKEWIIPKPIYGLCNQYVPMSILGVSFWNRRIEENKIEFEKVNKILRNIQTQEANISSECAIYYRRLNENND